MAKIGNVRKVRLEDLTPYARNARIHDEKQVDAIAESISRFGFISPVLADADGNVIAGHGRIMAAEKLGMKEVPVVNVEGLSEEERRAYILADNRLAEMGSWNMDTVAEELKDLKLDGFDLDLTGFDVPEEGDWFQDRERWTQGKQEGNEEYNAFVEKFEQKHTTDDCYTPDLIYDAVADYVASEYKLDRKNFVRPFFPGGDYQAESYAKDAVVVDNPPFSILSEIIRFYTKNGVKFFLFGPALTLFGRAQAECCTALAVNVAITYENGANVSTSFLTNLEPAAVCARSAPRLFAAVYEANEQSRGNKSQRKYRYPDEVITSAALGRLSKYGIDFSFDRAEAHRISELDQQKENGDAIFGGGYLLGEAATERRREAIRELDALEADWQANLARKQVEREAMQRIAEEVWQLSEREWAIVRSLAGRPQEGQKSDRGTEKR